VHGSVVRAVVLLSSSTLQGRLMGHMGDVLQMINRIETIRQTHFVPLVYWLASLGTGLLCVGLIITRVAALHEAVFFLGVIAFNLIFFAAPDSRHRQSLQLRRSQFDRIREPEGAARRLLQDRDPAAESSRQPGCA